MHILYKYDSIISGPNKEDLDAVVADTKKANLGVTVEGTLEDFLGGNINRRKYGSIHLTQNHIIDQIVKDLGKDNPKNTSKSTPAQPSKISHSHKQSENFDKNFHYRPVVGSFCQSSLIACGNVRIWMVVLVLTWRCF